MNGLILNDMIIIKGQDMGLLDLIQFIDQDASQN
jgi:hypothetical protein